MASQKQQPMVRLERDATTTGPTQKATPHLLPCRVHHTGSVEPVQSFWKPTQGEDGTSTAYFRGRKLVGKKVALPEGYRGLVAVARDGLQKEATEPDVDDMERDDGLAAAAGKTKTSSLFVQSEFDDMVVWSHEATVDGAADPYVRGVEEWLTLADQIHSFPAPTSDK
ncbi:ribonuclease H2 non-catalytic subunit-domain-containing protein [Lasiosphaeria ovina]|uniref:Ribonuclease H2 non-catalytic subunit-domain-containing protein n=1 Tax=Lasiosphaeria ovina TaxID=92902 RepID=A0AAE0JS32_9PEZI|nr:ribonuclease H2 non-catalytic subunit-domain-containing protein [Lasiosphaeria ovina]